MTDEEKEMLKEVEELLEELEKCFNIAQRLDALYPELDGAFSGTPSERIKRRLYALGIFK